MKTQLGIAALVALTTGCASQGIRDLRKVENYVKANSTPVNSVYESQIGNTAVQVAPTYIAFKVVHETESDILYDLGKNGVVEGMIGVHGPISSIDELTQDFSKNPT